MSPATSQIGNYLFKTPDIIAVYCSSDGPFQIVSDLVPFVNISLYHKECNW